jgi:hypothetical protein
MITCYRMARIQGIKLVFISFILYTSNTLHKHQPLGDHDLVSRHFNHLLSIHHGYQPKNQNAHARQPALREGK